MWKRPSCLSALAAVCVLAVLLAGCRSDEDPLFVSGGRSNGDDPADTATPDNDATLPPGDGDTGAPGDAQDGPFDVADATHGDVTDIADGDADGLGDGDSDVDGLGDEDADADGPGDGDADAEGPGDGDSDVDGLGDEDADADGSGDGDADAEGPGDGDADADDLGDGDADADGGEGTAGRCGTEFPPPGEGFVQIEAGTFQMGSLVGELGRSPNEWSLGVTLTRDYWLQATEVTQGQYSGLMGTNPSLDVECGDSCPVDSVSWLNAIAYANAFSREQGLPECYDAEGNVIGGPTVYDCCGYRLPTEAEWEFAARAGTTTATYSGDLTAANCSDTTLDAIAWFCGNGGGPNDGNTAPVATKAPNAWGLYDMLGNVREWTHDGYSVAPSGNTDPVGVPSSVRRVMRGGSWVDFAGDTRAAARMGYSPDARLYVFGFRLARTVDP